MILLRNDHKTTFDIDECAGDKHTIKKLSNDIEISLRAIELESMGS